MPQHQGQTEQVKKVQLPSAIHHVLWTKRMAAPGGKVGLEVYTHYVGNNSDLQIEFSDQSGKILGNYRDKMGGNRFAANITVPANAKDALYANVKLPKHGLSMKSGPLILLPPIQITNAKWDKQEARRGDILKLTADVKGVPDGTEALIEIWAHDADGVLELITKLPILVQNGKIEVEWQYQHPEDTDEVPPTEEAENSDITAEYLFKIIVGGILAISGLLQVKDWIEIELVDEADKPVTQERYQIVLPDGLIKDGKLNADGRARIYGIGYGSCKIIFPDLDQEAWEKI